MTRTSSRHTAAFFVSSALAVVVAGGLIACRNTPPPAAVAATPAASATPDAAEHPEAQPATAQAGADPVTKESLAKAIAGYVQAETARKGGVFMVPDPEQKVSLALTLTRVHEDRLTRLKDGRYFACADFKGRDGHVYDLDVLMLDSGKGLTASEVSVHKQDGRARYEWVEENGVWRKQAIGAR